MPETWKHGKLGLEAESKDKAEALVRQVRRNCQ